MTEKEKYYRSLVARFQKQYGVTEDELINTFKLREVGDSGALKQLCEKYNQPKLEYGYVHFYVAYRQWLRERGELDNN